MKVSHWIRTFERMWYLAVVNSWGSKYQVYLPVNALNFVYEDVNVIESPEDENQNYHFGKLPII